MSSFSHRVRGLAMAVNLRRLGVVAQLRLCGPTVADSSRPPQASQSSNRTRSRHDHDRLACAFDMRSTMRAFTTNGLQEAACSPALACPLPSLARIVIRNHGNRYIGTG
jgi:hypothetical protein